MNTDLALISENDLVLRDPDTGAPVGVKMPGGGDVTFDDLAGLALWARTIIDLERDALGPVKRMVGDAMNQHLNHAGKWTLHLDNGLTIRGESPLVGEQAVTTDAKGLYDDLVLLRGRDTTATDESQADLDAWLGEFFTVEVTLKDAGRKRLERMGGAYRDALETHTEAAPSAQKRPSVVRSK